jgi:hypothetical protein
MDLDHARLYVDPTDWEGIACPTAAAAGAPCADARRGRRAVAQSLKF